jgi:hypothetical protein
MLPRIAALRAFIRATGSIVAVWRRGKALL